MYRFRTDTPKCANHDRPAGQPMNWCDTPDLDSELSELEPGARPSLALGMLEEERAPTASGSAMAPLQMCFQSSAIWAFSREPSIEYRFGKGDRSKAQSQ